MNNLKAQHKHQLSSIKNCGDMAIEQLKTDLQVIIVVLKQITKRNLRREFITQANEKKRKFDCEEYIDRSLEKSTHDYGMGIYPKH